ncbi:DUF721 domain-containing protein [Candidatus Peregrinibacteria bacterium]|jgi:predicted nucleic acid-binding Zn ribbon protein|nr:DUF721 domain-containing protein [Candidatus Peregrinibacteria bacterium]MBT7484004.1 DUF721 domain-containing protein [Candidatus Peregrinibacteria bacterium]MBT7702924.1 DUF721 domain-containing protein [Candidatus Peregrinibacteria bacterium]
MGKDHFTQLSKLLPKITQRYNLGRQVKGALVCHHFGKIAHKLWNDSVDESIKAASFKDGVLKVVAKDSGWAQQVQFKRVDILLELRAACPDIPINDLRIRVFT